MYTSISPTLSRTITANQWQISIHLLSSRLYSSQSLPPELKSDADHLEAARWLSSFRQSGPETIPRNAYEISMTRSSGPGGQNVNKLSTKAMLRMPLPPPPDASGTPWLPSFTFPPLRRSPYFSTSPPSILLSSSTTRSAAQNRQLAIEKLHDLIVSSSETCIVTPTSEVQKEKVKGLIKKEERRRKEEKTKRSSKKGMRRGGAWD